MRFYIYIMICKAQLSNSGFAYIGIYIYSYMVDHKILINIPVYE